MSMNAEDYPRDIRITKIEQVTLKVDRPEIGTNSRAEEIIYPEPNWKWDEGVIRIHNSDGTLGWGVGRADAELAARALNRSPFDLIAPGAGVSDEFRDIENALWDSIGKILGEPVYQLIGDQSYADWLPVYDSAIYFNDLLYDSKEAGLKRIAEDAESSVRNGFRACKMKIGRGCFLMDHDEGLKRDIEVVKIVREVVGEDFTIHVDANNGYTYHETVAFLDATSDVGIFWIEEMFEEEVEAYRNLKAAIKERNLKTLIADGEGRSREPLEFYTPFFEEGVLDVIQHDIRALGITGWRRLSAMAGEHGVKCAPHNWSSLLGLFLSFQLGKTIPNFLYGECATLASDVIDTSGYVFKDGAFSVPDTPGLGLELNQRVYDEQYAGRENWVVES